MVMLRLRVEVATRLNQALTETMSGQRRRQMVKWVRMRAMKYRPLTADRLTPLLEAKQVVARRRPAAVTHSHRTLRQATRVLERRRPTKRFKTQAAECHRLMSVQQTLVRELPLVMRRRRLEAATRPDQAPMETMSGRRRRRRGNRFRMRAMDCHPLTAGRLTPVLEMQLVAARRRPAAARHFPRTLERAMRVPEHTQTTRLFRT